MVGWSGLSLARDGYAGSVESVGFVGVCVER